MFEFIGFVVWTLAVAYYVDRRSNRKPRKYLIPNVCYEHAFGPTGSSPSAWVCRNCNISQADYSTQLRSKDDE